MNTMQRSLSVDDGRTKMNELARFKAHRGHRSRENQLVQLSDADISQINLQRALLRRQEALERLVAENKILERKLRRQAARRQSAEEDAAASSDSNQVVTYHRYHHDYPNELTARHVPAAVPAMTTTLPYVVDVSSLMQQQQQQPNYQQSPNVKSGVIDMMLMQNAQMHQLLMHRLMLASVPKSRAVTPAAAPRHSDVITKTADVIELLRGTAPQTKPQTVHHHHYNTVQPTPQVVQLPPMQLKKPPAVCYPRYSVAKSQCCCCHDDEIMKPMRYWSPAPSNNVTVIPEQRPIRTRPRNYGANSASLRRFRRVAFVVLFTKIMQGRNARMLLTLRYPVLTDELMAKVRVRECVHVIHNNFTTRPGRVAGVLKPLINDTAIDLTAAIADNSSKGEEDAAVKSLATVFENIVYFMTDIMPTNGVLGTNAKALLYRILQPGHVFPVNYFWAIEKEILKRDSRDRPTALDDSDAHILLIGLFIGRALIRTVLTTPEKYGIVSRVGNRARQNLRLISSLFTYLLRRLYVQPKSTILAIPAELSSSMHTDDELKTLIKRLKTSFEYSEKILRDWSREYIKRMRAVALPPRA